MRHSNPLMQSTSLNPSPKALSSTVTHRIGRDEGGSASLTGQYGSELCTSMRNLGTVKWWTAEVGSMLSTVQKEGN